MALELDTERQSLLRPEGLDDGGFGAECDDPDGPVMVLPDEAVLWKAGAVMYNFFATGIFTSSIGALLPLIESHYRVGDAAAAVIFLVLMAGYLVGTSVVHEVHGRFGRRGASALTALPHLVALTLLSTRPTYYPVLLAAYFSFGMGTGCSDASFCTWAAGLAGHAGNKISGLIHGSYSAGCVMGPVVVALLERWELLHQQQWFIFYRIMIPAFILELVALSAAFWRDEKHTADPTDLHKSGSRGFSGSLQAILLCSLFSFLYIGVESSLSGWLATYMTRDRHAAPSTAALTTSVFWAGMVVGRFSLGIISRLMRGNLRWMVVVFAGTSLALQIMFRHTTDLQLLLVLIAAIGVVSGPIYPSGLLTLTRTIPASIHVRAVALTCSVGQLGGAGAPFLTGVIAQTSGIRRLFDVVLGLTVAELAVWLWFSRPRKDKEIVPDDDEEEE